MEQYLVYGSGKSYTVVVTPNADAEGNISIAMNPNGGAKDASGNNLNIQLGSENSNALSYSQAFDTKAPSVETISVFPTGTSNVVNTVSSTVDLKIVLSEM